MTQADISVGCVYTFLFQALGIDRTPSGYASLAVAAVRCEALPAFRAAAAGEFVVPKT